MRAVVIGGGVAGPATALGLRKAGIEVTLLERRAAPDDTGSYLTLAPNGVAALEVLHARGPVQAAAIASHNNAMHGATGNVLGRVSLGAPLTDGTVGLTLKRSRLAAILSQVAGQHGATTRWGSEVTGLHHGGDSVAVQLAGGERLTANVVIGADGVHSRTRAWLDPTAPAARYVGLTNFGGITTDTPLAGSLEPQSWHFVFGRRSFFGAHPTPRGDVVWFVNVPGAKITPEQRANTTSQQWLDRLVALTADDAGPAAELLATGRLELAGDNTHDIGHVPVWHDDRVVLIGDAAHAPAPSSGQGAAMALEDAVVLAQALRDEPNVPDAVRAYEQARRERVERIVKTGARSSSTKIPGRMGRPLREAVMSLAFKHFATEEKMAWMTGYRVPRTPAADIATDARVR